MTSHSISWNYFFTGYNSDYTDYNGRYPISTRGCGSSFHSIIFGIPYDQEMQNNDCLCFEMELSRANSDEQRTAVQIAHLNQIWWRHLEARPIWARLPAFIYAWLYTRISH